MRALDAGEMGVIAPMIATAEQARRLFPPAAIRPQAGFDPVRARLAWQGAYSTASANASVLVFAMIQRRRGPRCAPAVRRAGIGRASGIHPAQDQVFAAMSPVRIAVKARPKSSVCGAKAIGSGRGTEDVDTPEKSSSASKNRYSGADAFGRPATNLNKASTSEMFVAPSWL